MGRVLRNAGGTVERLEVQNSLLRERIADDRELVRREIADYREAILLYSGGWLTRDESGQLRNGHPALAESARESDTTAVVQCKERIAELELALEDRGWKRQLAIAESEFSRFGIQQLMLISRLYFIKNPLIKRGVQVSSHYVFGRGLEISSTDETANEVLQSFFSDTRNKELLGQRGLVTLEETCHTDGNLFFAFFTSVDDGQTVVRLIDAAEMEEIVTNPDDHAEPWFFHRRWMRQEFNPTQGTTTPKPMDAWYVALDYDPPAGLTEIRGMPLVKDETTGDFIRVYHVKAGGLPKWHFATPMVYAAIDWARAYRHFLEDWATITRALARFAFNVETQGGPAAISAFKQTLATTLGNDGQSIESNPPPTVASAFITGPGNKLTPVRTANATTNPEQGRRVMLMVAAAFGLPETFFGDASTGSLATAQSLDRPTELKFLEAQERWREVLQRISREVLKRSLGAPKGKLRAAFREEWQHIAIEMTPVERSGVRVFEAKRPIRQGVDTITVDVKFPSILEHDIDKRVGSIAQAMTLGNKSGTVIGIDERVGVGLLLAELGVEDVQGVLEVMYPQSDYDDLVNRTEQMKADAEQAKNPPPPPPPVAGPPAQLPAPANPPAPKSGKAKEAAVQHAVVELRRALRRLDAAHSRQSH